jgi:radical SAM-linked protein
MVGLPTETEEDLEGIIRLCNNILALGKRTTKRHVQINVTISTFVPKPHTPFQWFGQTPIGEIRAKQAYLEKGLRKRGIALKPHNPEMSLLEAAFAKGDRSLGKVIEKAVQMGCRFDGWTECFDFGKWAEAFRACGLEPASFAYRHYKLDDPLPWDFIETGVTTEFLKREYARALSAEITDNCRIQCEGCGIGCEDGGSASLGKPSTAGVPTLPPGPVAKVVNDGDMITRMRFKYTKTGRLRFLSHLDLMTLFQRAAVRAEVPLAFSQGFNPHPKMSFGPALPVGVESETEYLDMETDPLIDLLTITKSLNQTLPPGIRIIEARIVPRKAPSLSGSISRYIYRVEAHDRYAQGLADRVRIFIAQTSVVVEKEGKQKDIRPAIESINTVPLASGTVLEVTLQDKDNVRARIQDVVEKIFEIGQEESAIFRIRRTALFCSVDDRWAGPMDVV